jgi:hypothetical protein
MTADAATTIAHAMSALRRSVRDRSGERTLRG